jgi:hypothetical protein
MTADHAEFQKVFVPKIGRAHHFNKAWGVNAWLRFVFERWSIVRQILHEHNIGFEWISQMISAPPRKNPPLKTVRSL